MASSWGGSWGQAWGNAWGVISEVTEPVRRIIVYGWERRKKKKRKLDPRTVAMWAVGSGMMR
jgi:hypothetical protein